MDRVTDKHGL